MSGIIPHTVSSQSRHTVILGLTVCASPNREGYNLEYLPLLMPCHCKHALKLCLPNRFYKFSRFFVGTASCKLFRHKGNLEICHTNPRSIYIQKSLSEFPRGIMCSGRESNPYGHFWPRDFLATLAFTQAGFIRNVQPL